MDIGAAVSDITVTTSIEDLSSAAFTVALSDVEAPIDYLAEVRISVGEDLIFTGAVLDSVPDSGGARINCRAAPALEELILPPSLVRDTRAVDIDIIYMTLRTIGWPEARMSLDGLDELPFEPFRVIAPIAGVSLSQETKVGDVRLLPADAVTDPLVDFGPIEESEAREDIVHEFGGDVHAVAVEPAARVFDAEQAGLRSIDLALAWLTARARYGLARASNGDPVRFHRARTLARPVRGGIVYTRGLETGRRAIRLLRAIDPREGSLSDEQFDFLSEGLPSGLRLQDQQAILACRRAVMEDDPLAGVAALWEAIEFYVAESRAPSLFPSAVLSSIKLALRQTLPSGLTSEQAARIDQLLGDLNSPPLLTRLRATLDQDGVPVSDGDIALLQRLRRLRNNAVHGRTSELPTNEELEHAISIMARMLLYRVARLRGDPQR